MLQDALLKNDATTLSLLLASDFGQQQIDGTVQARQPYIKEQTESTPGLALSSLKIVLTSLTMHGDEGRAETTYTYLGTYTVAGVPKPFRGVTHLTDRWKLESGTWMLRSSIVHDEVSYVDGEVVQSQREQLAPAKAAIAELRDRALVIPTLALDADPDQLAAIGEAIGDARIVGMGEGSHGTSEFFAFKNRLFKYLVEKKGFTVFAMEAHWGAGLDVDRYIKTGHGTAAQAVSSLGFWTWETPEVVNLIQWMRDYNASPVKHTMLSFAGVDMQDPMGAIGYVADYLRAHDPEESAVARLALQCAVDSVAKPAAAPDAGCRDRVAAIGHQLVSLKGAPDFATAQQAVTVILQYLDWKGRPETAKLTIRDEAMAKNVEWVAANNPEAKIALWAHNGHVGTTSELSYRPMGSYLRQAFGQNYYVIGQTFGAGTVRAAVSGRLQTVTIPSNPNDTVAELFAPLNAVAFVDLRGLRSGSALQTFFSTEHGVEEIGGGVDPSHPDDKLPMVIPNSFDGLVYVPTSTASAPGTAFPDMHRDVREAGSDWKVLGVGFDDVTVTVTPSEATIANVDALNATQNGLLRRFDATAYAGQTVRIQGEIITGDLLGYAIPLAEVITSTAAIVSTARGEAVMSKDRNWIPFTLTMKIPQNASSMYIGFLAEGLGPAKVRNLRIEEAAMAR
jgi:erythromycin esterase